MPEERAPDPEVIHAIVRLMTGDLPLSDLTEDQLQAALIALRRRDELQGQIAALLYEKHGWTWQRIADLFQPPVDQSTVWRWAEPYRRNKPP